MPDYEPTRWELQESQSAVSFAPSSEVVKAELADAPQPPLTRYRRRIGLPLALFLLTCLSTWFVGATGWMPMDFFLSWLPPGIPPADFQPYLFLPLRRVLLANWQTGLIYMGCVLAILLTHEMGHFLVAVLHRVRASLPYFLPLPIHPFGTLGAVIGMDGMRADRRQIFDIGLAGPLAGLVVAVPIVWIGTLLLDLQNAQPDALNFQLPLATRFLVDYLHPGQYNPQVGVPIRLMNPFFMAGWVGLLVTGLNMMPVSQLDGGHLIYTLFGRPAHWIARLFLLTVFVYMGVSYALYRTQPTWLLMAILVLLMGTDHPPTRDDNVPLGWPRIIIGLASLLIPVFCFTPIPIVTL